MDNLTKAQRQWLLRTIVVMMHAKDYIEVGKERDLAMVSEVLATNLAIAFNISPEEAFAYFKDLGEGPSSMMDFISNEL